MKKILLILFLCGQISCFATKWLVGPTRTYTVPSQVSSLVSDGDTVEIDAGLYTGDCVAWQRNNLYLKGVGSGYAHIDANGNNVWGKGIWVAAGNNITVENIEFSGATVVDQNGAGIRLDGSGLTVRHCYFHNNENGILGGASGDILIEYTEFAYNGFGDGYTHNIYINHANSLTVKYCYSHHAIIGHCIKSRAHKNYILYNRIMDESDGTSSRNIDLPNGGLAIILGNIIQQGPSTENNNLLGYGLEGLTNNAPHQLYIINNTFVDQRGFNGLFVSVQNNTDLLKMYNNIFAGGPATLLSGTPLTLDSSNNLIVADTSLAGLISVKNYDYHLSSASPAIDAGTNSGSAGSFSLTPLGEYLHPHDSLPRLTNGALDIGAYEYTANLSVGEHQKENENIVFCFNSENHQLIIKSSDEEIMACSIFNASGRLIKQFCIKGNKEINISFEMYTKGLYMLNLETQTKQFVRKFIFL